MSVELVHPAGVNEVPFHHQVSVAKGAQVISLAGQVSWDITGQLLGAGDLVAQTEQCHLNIDAALNSVGASMNDLMHLTFCVVDLDSEKGELILEGRARAAKKLGVALQQPFTAIGVTSLWSAGYLIEIQATAVLG